MNNKSKLDLRSQGDLGKSSLSGSKSAVGETTSLRMSSKTLEERFLSLGLIDWVFTRPVLISMH